MLGRTYDGLLYFQSFLLHAYLYRAHVSCDLHNHSTTTRDYLSSYIMQLQASGERVILHKLNPRAGNMVWIFPCISAILFG